MENDGPRTLKPVEWQILAVAATAGPESVWATEIARILGRSHGGVVAPVAALVSRGLLTVSDTSRAQKRKRGLRQMVSINYEGRRVLFSECSASALIADLQRDTPVDETLRITFVATVIYGTPGYCLVGLAKDKRTQSGIDSAPPEPFTSFNKRIRENTPHVRFAFEELAKLTTEARSSLAEWETNSLKALWWHVRQRFPRAVKAYQQIKAGSDPDKVLRMLREEEDRQREEDW